MAGHDGWKNQPRVPKGKTEGGQFTTKGGVDVAGRAAEEAAGLTENGWRIGKHDLELARRFIEARNSLNNDKIGYLSDYTAEDIINSDKEIFLHEDGENGFILDNGDLQSLFSTNSQGTRSILLAISKGAVTLDCFDGYLPGRYVKHGFEEYKREPNWTPGEPDVVFMRLRKE